MNNVESQKIKDQKSKMDFRLCGRRCLVFDFLSKQKLDVCFLICLEEKLEFSLSAKINTFAPDSYMTLGGICVYHRTF